MNNDLNPISLFDLKRTIECVNDAVSTLIQAKSLLYEGVRNSHVVEDKLSTYRRFVIISDQRKRHQDLAYLILGLVGEAGEVAETYKKYLRLEESATNPYPFAHDPTNKKIFEELGDVLWYWMMICIDMGFSPEAVIQANIRKLAERYGLTLPEDEKASNPGNG